MFGLRQEGIGRGAESQVAHRPSPGEGPEAVVVLKAFARAPRPEAVRALCLDDGRPRLAGHLPEDAPGQLLGYRRVMLDLPAPAVSGRGDLGPVEVNGRAQRQRPAVARGVCCCH